MAKGVKKTDVLTGGITPRYKPRLGRIDFMKILPSRAPGQGGVEEENLFWLHEFATGSRPDGSNWFVTLSSDDSQNYALEAGYARQESICCFVLHMASIENNQTRIVNEALVWSFKNDKWAQLQAHMQVYGDDLSAHELCITCIEEKFQKVTIQVMPKERHILNQVNAESLESFKASIKKARGYIADFVKADNREDQISTIRGRGTGGGGPGPAQNPMAGGLDLSGLNLGGNRSAAPAVVGPTLGSAGGSGLILGAPAPLQTQPAPTMAPPPVAGGVEDLDASIDRLMRRSG